MFAIWSYAFNWNKHVVDIQIFKVKQTNISFSLIIVWFLDLFIFFSFHCYY